MLDKFSGLPHWDSCFCCEALYCSHHILCTLDALYYDTLSHLCRRMTAYPAEFRNLISVRRHSQMVSHPFLSQIQDIHDDVDLAPYTHGL